MFNDGTVKARPPTNYFYTKLTTLKQEERSGPVFGG